MTLRRQRLPTAGAAMAAAALAAVWMKRSASASTTKTAATAASAAGAAVLPVPADVARAQNTEFGLQLTSPGRLRAVDSAPAKAKVAAEGKRLNMPEMPAGNRVQAGQLIGRLDGRGWRSFACADAGGGSGGAT